MRGTIRRSWSAERALTLTLTLTFVALSAYGCASAPSVFDGGRFTHRRYDYVVHYDEGSETAPTFLSSDWALDNYYLRSGRLVPRVGANYQASIDYDQDGDGRTEGSETVPIYDLRLVHRQHDGAIWVSSVVLSERLARVDLRVLAQRYVESVAASGDLNVQRLGVSTPVETNRFATRVIEEHAIALDGQEAHSMTFEVANVDQLELDRDSRRSRVQVILTRPGFTWVPRGSGSGTTHVPRDRGWPVLVILGYRALPEYFDESLVDFQSFLEKVRFNVYGAQLAGLEGAFVDCWEEHAQGNEREPVVLSMRIDGEGKIRRIDLRGALGHLGVQSVRVLGRVERCFAPFLEELRFPEAARRRIRVTIDPELPLGRPPYEPPPAEEETDEGEPADADPADADPDAVAPQS